MGERNLWGELVIQQTITPPALILKEQAEQLRKLTKGILDGRIASQQSGDQINMTLSILAPALNYSAGIVQIVHPVTLYPATVINARSGGRPFNCTGEEQLIAALGEILRSEPVQRLVAALISQSLALKQQ